MKNYTQQDRQRKLISMTKSITKLSQVESDALEGQMTLNDA